MRYFLLILGLAFLTVVTLAGKRGALFRRPPIEIFSDMVRQPKIRPQARNNLLPEQSSSQLPPDGTIARTAPLPVGRELVYHWQELPVTTGRLPGTTNFIPTNPFPVTAEFLRRGQERFDIYCAACHTRLGDGNSVARRIAAMPVVANLHDKRIVELPDGEIFHTVSYGKNLMPGYAATIEIRDRWAIVAYLRALQLSRLGTLDDVPENLRSTLK